MEKGLRRREEEGLPALGQADGGCTNPSPPRVLRFNETPRRPSLGVGAQKTSDKLPELARRESIISTYCRELYQPRMVTFMKNGDRYFEGIKVNVSARNFRHWEVLLAELSRSIGLPAGVRNIYTPDGGHKITALNQFQHQKVYVCASTEPFKKIVYAKVKTPTWHAGTKIKHTTETLLDLSRNFQSVGVEEFRNQIGTNNDSLSPSLPIKHRKRKTGLARKISFLPSQTLTKVVKQRESNKEENIKRKSTITRAHPPYESASQFTIICTKPLPMKVVKVFLDRDHLTSWESALSLIHESLPQSNRQQKLYSVDGQVVESLSQLWATNRVLISAKDNDIGTTFLQSVKETASTNGGDVYEDDHQMMSESKKLCTVEAQATTVEQEKASRSGPPTKNFLVESSLTSNTNNIVKNWEHVQQTKHQVENMDTVRNSEEIEENSKGTETVREVQMVEEKEVSHNNKTMTISETNLLYDTNSPIYSPTSLSSPSKDIQPQTFSQGSSKDTQQSSKETQQSGQDIQPTNSVLALTEDGSFLGSGSPLTMDRVAAIQHVHRLALQYDIDRLSTSGSECSTNMGQSSASKPSVFCPGTPQSNISFSHPRSLVEMIMPRENGYNYGTSVESGSSSSTPHSSSLHIKSRTIGIQTDLIGDKISAIIEEDQRPLNVGPSQNKRKTTHPLFHSQTSTVSQLNTDQSQNPKESYRLGSIVAEGRFAVVRDCRHKVTGRQYSLRVINKAGVFGHEDLVLRECELLRGLKHDNLVQVMDWWETSDDLYMVAEHIEGTDLFDGVLHCRHFSEGDAVNVMRQLSMALVYLHAHKIVHRDVKMENIILHQSGSEGGWSLKLGGMALAAKASEPLSLVCGNIFYMAPEMIAGTGYGTKLDVWAAGVICCTVLSGIMPFGSNSKRATVANVQKGKYAFLSPFWDDVSDDAKDFVRCLLVVSPSKRYMATQMLQHPWLGRERWRDVETSRDPRLGQILLDHLVSKASTGKNAALPTLIETALDKRKTLPNIDQLKRTSHKTFQRS